jgi:hypothetical protein
VKNPKDQVMELLKKLPDDSTYDDIVYEIEFFGGIGEGLAQLDRGEGIPNEQVKQRLKRSFR